MCTYCFEAFFKNWSLKRRNLRSALKADNYDVQNNIKMHHGPSLPRQTVVGLAKQIANMRVKYSDSQRSNLQCKTTLQKSTIKK